MNVGAPELLFIIFGAIVSLAIDAGIGYWCMKLFEGKGRSGGAGFAMGFAMSFFLSIAGAVAAVLIAYLISPAYAGAGAPAYATGPSAYSTGQPATAYAAGPAAPTYATGPAAPPYGSVPPSPPPFSPYAQTVATFNASTGWDGRRIVYDNGVLQIEGVGAVTPADALAYAQNGQTDWASDAMRDWVTEWAARG